MMNILEEIHDIKGQLTAVYYAMTPETDEEFRRMGIKAADKITEKLVAIEKYLHNDSTKTTREIVEGGGVPILKYDVEG